MTPNPKLKELEFSTSTDKQTKIDAKIIASNDEIEFVAKLIKTPPKKFYKKETENNLLKNPYLSTGGNILGIFQIIEYYIKKNSYIIYEENNSIKLKINIEHPIIKFIDFILLEEKKDINTQVSELTSYVYETLVNKIKSLEEKNNEYQKQIEEMKKEYQNKFEQLIEINKKYENKFEKLLEMNKKYENKINNLEKMIKDLHNLNGNKKACETSIFNSKINIDESLVKSWLNNRKFRATLLFRMSEDGDSFEIFHNKCDNK